MCVCLHRYVYKSMKEPMPQGTGTGASADPTKATATPRHGGDAPVTPPAAHGTGRHPSRATVATVR